MYAREVEVRDDNSPTFSVVVVIHRTDKMSAFGHSQQRPAMHEHRERRDKRRTLVRMYTYIQDSECSGGVASAR